MLRSRFLLPCFTFFCLVSICGFVLVGLWAFLFVWLYPFPFYGLVGCNHVWEYIFMMLAYLLLAFLSFVWLCTLGFLMLALYMPYNMVNFPLCVITCLASFMFALCHLVWVSLLWFASLHPCLCVHAYVFVCLLCHQASFLPMISCGLTPIFVHEIPSPF